MPVVEIISNEKGGTLNNAVRPLPQPQFGQVLIEVSASGVNRPDIMQRLGHYPPPEGASDLPGLEVAGSVVAVGPGVQKLDVNSKVCALVSGGGYAGYCVAYAEHCLPVPRGFTMVEAAALPECFFTVWTNVFERGQLKAGETFLVHGGSSGIGTTAIQLAAHFGARVFTTVGSAEKCTACTKLGAESAINYKEKDFVKELRELTKGQGVDVILDMVGGSYISRNIEILRKNGRMVLISFLGGSKISIDMMPVLQKWITITGSTLRPRNIVEKGKIAEKLFLEVWPLLETGKIRPKIAQTFPLNKAADAHKLMESSGHTGKIILTL